MSRTQKTVVVLVAIVALIMGLTVYKVLASKGAGGDKLAQLDAGIVLLPSPRELPDRALLDQDGRVVQANQLKGKWSLVFFGYTFCPDICPTTLAQLRQLQGQLPEAARNNLQVLLVTVDPERDSPERLKEYLGFFDANYQGLTGEMADIQALASALSIPFIPADTRKENYTVDHGGNLAIVGPDGRMHGFVRAPLVMDKLPAPLSALLQQR